MARRLPPHITILFPFARATAVDDDLGADLAAHFAAFEPFEAALTRVGRFDGFVWLAPEPRDRFVELIIATVRALPGVPAVRGRAASRCRT